MIEISEERYLQLCQERYRAAEYAKTKHMNMEQLEQLIGSGQMELGRLLLQSRLAGDPRGQEEEKPACSKCGWGMRVQEKSQQRKLRTSLGEVLYRRSYAVCDRCGHTQAPLDAALGIPRVGPSVGVLRRICQASIVGRSFEAARDALMGLAGIRMGRQHVRTTAEREGRRMVGIREEEIQGVRAGAAAEAKAGPELLVIGSDGGRVQTRHEKGEDGWKEDKVGVVYDAAARPQPQARLGEYEGARARVKTYAATMKNWADFGWILYAEALKRGLGAAGQVVLFIADGAKHIRELQRLHFGCATFILDWAHAAGHLAQSAKAFFGEGSQEAADWFKRYKQKLWDGEVDEVIVELKRMSEIKGLPERGAPESDPRAILYRDAFSFFPNNRDAMDYPTYRSKGWPIGSGVAEGAVKQFAMRMKGSEKFWNLSYTPDRQELTRETGAEEMLALCALYYSEDGRWDRYWDLRARGENQR